MHDRFYSVLTGIYHLSVITCEYYAHNRIYSRQLQVLHAQQDSLASIQLLLVSTKCMTGIMYLRVVSTPQQLLASSVLLVSYEPNTRVIFKISRATKHYSHVFVNLVTSCTVYNVVLNYKGFIL